MAEKLWLLLPEMVLLAAAVVVSVLGLSPRVSRRNATAAVTCAALAIAAALTPVVYAGDAPLRAGLLLPALGLYVKIIVCLIGIVLALLSMGLIDQRLEASFRTGATRFDSLRVARGEYFAFFLLSLTGVMLLCNANDLIWLFLALELTSLPTYVMVAMSRPSRKAQEAAVKYFFLGAMAAAMFLYGFALLYGSTGTIVLTDMAAALSRQAAAGGLNSMAVMGMILAILGISFKIAAAPMHFYAADVYEGAAAPVTAFLAFVPKAAGFLALILLLECVGWSGHYDSGVPGLPAPIVTVLWMLAVLTMTLGNVGALLQRSVKRLLAYSSIAHSGYMIIGLIAGPAVGGSIDGLGAVLFYLLAYGVMNTAAFAVLAALERKGGEIETLEELSGLRQRHPLMAAVLAVAALSLVGMPPLIGFVGKLFLFIAGVEAGQIMLVVIAALNSAVSAFYYLLLLGLPVISKSTPQSETVVRRPLPWARLAGVVTAAAILLLPLPFVAEGLLKASAKAARSDSMAGPATVRQDDASKRLLDPTSLAR